jgi:hypothetical protein
MQQNQTQMQVMQKQAIEKLSTFFQISILGLLFLLRTLIVSFRT